MSHEKQEIEQWSEQLNAIIQSTLPYFRVIHLIENDEQRILLFFINNVASTMFLSLKTETSEEQLNKFWGIIMNPRSLDTVDQCSKNNENSALAVQLNDVTERLRQKNQRASLKNTLSYFPQVIERLSGSLDILFPPARRQSVEPRIQHNPVKGRTGPH